jgi:hypothetical protein
LRIETGGQYIAAAVIRRDECSKIERAAVRIKGALRPILLVVVHHFGP